MFVISALSKEIRYNAVTPVRPSVRPENVCNFNSVYLLILSQIILYDMITCTHVLEILEFSFLPQGVNEVPKNVVDIQYIEHNFKLFFKGFIAYNFFHIPPGLWRNWI